MAQTHDHEVVSIYPFRDAEPSSLPRAAITFEGAAFQEDDATEHWFHRALSDTERMNQERAARARAALRRAVWRRALLRGPRTVRRIAAESGAL
jgi:hypothetical protein